MKCLSIALLLMMSFTVPSLHTGGRTPAAQVKESPVEELLKKALEARERGDYEGALVILREAQKLDPESTDVNFYTGLTLFNLGKFEDGESVLREVLKKDPLYVNAKIVLGRVLLSLGKLTDSERLLREAIAQAPESAEAYEALASNLLAQKKTDEALFILDLGLGRLPDHPVLLIKKGKIFFINKDHRKAEGVARVLTGITDISGRYQGHLLLGKIGFEENPMRIDLVTPDLEEAIDLAPVETEGHLVLADVYISMWKFEKAKTVLENAFDLVRDRKIIELKLAEMAEIEKDVLNFSVSASSAETNFKDGNGPWKDFYLDAVWRIDPYKSLVFGFEMYDRGALEDESLRVQYIEKVSQWVYIYASAKFTPDAEFREKSAFSLGTNFVVNPLKGNETTIVAEAEVKNYESGRVYFLTGGIDQNLSESFMVSARVFRVITDTRIDNLWTVKTTWSLTPNFSLSANYGTRTEDHTGRPVRGTSKGVGAEYRINDRVSLTGNYQRVNNEMYRANQVTAGIKVKLGPSRTQSASSPSASHPPKKRKKFFGLF